MWELLSKIRAGVDNPVLVKELRSRMRGKNVFIIQTVYLLLLAISLYIVWVSGLLSQQTSGYQSDQAGVIIFSTLFFLQIFLVTYIGPAFTCGALTREKEQKTFDLLNTTLVSPRQIVWGKLGSSLSYIVLLLVSSIPLVCLTFLFGGVSPQQVLFSYIGLFFWCAFLGLIGLHMSARFKRTLTATIATYGFIFFVSMPGAQLIPLLFYALMSWRGTAIPSPSLSVLMFGGTVPQITIFNLKLPYWILPLLFGGWAFALLLTKTNNILYGRRVYQSGLLRLLFLIFLIMLLFFVLGGFWSGLPSLNMDKEEEMITVGCIFFGLLVLFSLLSSVFCCEPPFLGWKKSSGLKNLFYPGSLSGVTFLISLFLLSLISVDLLMFSRGIYAQGYIPQLVITPLMTFSYLFAMAMIGFFFSSSVLKTVTSQKILNGFVLATWLLPLPGLIARLVNKNPQVWYGGSFFNPFLAIGSLWFEKWPQDIVSPWGKIPIWLPCLAIYFILSVIFLTINLLKIKAIKRR